MLAVILEADMPHALCRRDANKGRGMEFIMANIDKNNILFPMDMLLKIVALLGHWDISGDDCSIKNDYSDVLNAIGKTFQTVELHKASIKIRDARDEESRYRARKEYLKLWDETQTQSPLQEYFIK
jgi:hypothetical protein